MESPFNGLVAISRWPKKLVPCLIDIVMEWWILLPLHQICFKSLYVGVRFCQVLQFDTHVKKLQFKLPSISILIKSSSVLQSTYHLRQHGHCFWSLGSQWPPEKANFTRRWWSLLPGYSGAHAISFPIYFLIMVQKLRPQRYNINIGKIRIRFSFSRKLDSFRPYSPHFIGSLYTISINLLCIKFVFIFIFIFIIH